MFSIFTHVMTPVRDTNSGLGYLCHRQPKLEIVVLFLRRRQNTLYRVLYDKTCTLTINELIRTTVNFQVTFPRLRVPDGCNLQKIKRH